MRLAGKVAIVTGSSRGIGRAIALALAKEGADIVAAARSTDAAPSALPGTVDKTASEVMALGRKAMALKVDLTKDQDIEDMIKKTMEQFGRIDILVNNAAIGFPGNLVDLPIKRWDILMSINLRAPFITSKLVLPIMIEQRSGSILNISSIASRSTEPGLVAYGVSKAGLERLTIGMAAEVKEFGIAVNAIALEFPVASEGFMYLNPGVDYSTWEKPEIMGEAAVWVLTRDPRTYTGRVVTITDLRQEYASAQ